MMQQQQQIVNNSALGRRPRVLLSSHQQSTQWGRLPNDSACTCRAVAGRSGSNGQQQPRQFPRAAARTVAVAAAAAAAAAPAAAAAAPARVRSPEEKAAFSRPPGWVAPGPQPIGPNQGPGGAPDPELAPRDGEETLSFLAGDWRLFQLVNGHRWSLDDHVTAVVALQEAARLAAAGRPVRRALDLGCGIGSVLLMVAWGLPDASLVGVEAQDVSVALARRSVRYNLGGDGRVLRSGGDDSGGGDSSGDSSGSSSASGQCRVALVHGDLRDPLPRGVAPEDGFDLVTGTPPYIPLGGGGASARPQKTPCNLETRGGVEGYVAAAARALAPGGAAVVCMGVQGQPSKVDRVFAAAPTHGLAVRRCVEIVPREGKPPLMRVYALGHAADGDASEAALIERFVVRLADGSLSPEMHAARAAIGMPPARSSSGASGA